MLAIFVVASASASDLNETSLSETDANDAGIISASDDNEIDGVENDFNLSNTDASTYSELSTEIGSGGNIELEHNYYTYDNGSTISITTANSVIDGKGAIIDMAGSSIRVFSVSASDVTIKNLTIKNANINDNGGAIYFSSWGAVKNCNFTGNSAKYGGAVYFGSSGTVTNCSFVNNRATSDDGGAVYFGSSGTVTNCSLVNNKATTSGNGGAIYFNGNGGVTNCNFTNNKAWKYGGAIFMIWGTVENCNFTGNSAYSGSAVYLYNNGEVSNCNFVNNAGDSSIYGETIYFNGNGNVTNCNFTGNSASSGSAVYFNYGHTGSVINCNFVNNKATSGSGAICFGSSGSVINCSFLDCAADKGGAILFNSQNGNINNFIINCHFENCSKYAIYDNGGSCIITDSSFIGEWWYSPEYGFEIHNVTVNNVLYELPSFDFSKDNNTINLMNNYTINDSPLLVSGNNIVIDGNGNHVYSDNLAYAFDIKGGNVTIKNINFENVGIRSEGANTTILNCNVTGNSAYKGGAVYMTSGTVTNCNFTDNQVTTHGGAVYFYEQGTVTNCNFVNNKVTTYYSYGGAVYFYEQGTVTNCNFVNNKVTADYSYGGAVYFYRSGSVENCSFVNNTATDYGGAVRFRISGSANVVENCSFVNNSAKYGGAVSFYGSGSVENCSFVNNKATSGNGGAINMGSGTVTNCSFVNNNATQSGGVIYLDSSGSVINCSFLDCAADKGGAIFLNGQNNYIISCHFENCSKYAIYDNGGSCIITDSSFIGEWWYSPEYGFEIHNVTVNNVLYDWSSFDFSKDNNTINLMNNYTMNDSPLLVSGNNIVIDGNGNHFYSDNLAYAFDIRGSNVTIKNINFENVGIRSEGANTNILNCNFVNNTVSNSGGAIYFSSSGTVSNCYFVNNTATEYGGAIIMGSGTVTNCNFVNNKATSFNGGAVYFDSSGSVINCIFINNKVTRNYSYGGAIYFKGNGTVENCYFVNNTATEYGGAVYFKGNSTVENCSFVNNSASHGGAVYFSSGSANVVENCNFVNNKATSYYGGAIYGYSSYSGSVLNCSFVGNSAKSGGAIYFNDGGLVIGCSFTGNFAENIGGAVVNAKVSNSLFDNNQALGSGGAICRSVIGNCSFINNHADGYGGAIYDSKIVYANNFRNNSASNGNNTYNVTFFLDSYTFSDLNLLINDNNSLDIYLLGNYIFTNDLDFSDGITINRNVTIHGNGFTIDADDKARIFKITDGNVIFKDIIFTNGKTAGIGGAIFGACTVVNCTFISNSAKYNGGAIFGACTAVNCSFIGNSASYGGAIAYGSAVNCSFMENKGVPDSLEKSRFDDNYYGYSYGGAMYQGTAINCSFVNNEATGPTARGFGSRLGGGYGGAMYQGTAINCTFSGNDAYKGDSMYDSTGVDCIINGAYPNDSMYHYTSHLNVNDLTVFGDESAYLIVNLSDIRGPLFSRIITFNVNGIEYNVTTDINGLAIFNIKNYLTEQGSYNVMVSYAGDNVNYPVSKNITVTVANYYTNLEVNNLTVNIGEGVLIASLSDMNGQLYGKTVTFTIEGVEHNVTTDSDGLAKININDYLTRPGNYNIDVSFAGDESNSPASTVSHVIITKFDPILEVDDLSIVLGDDGFLTVRLYDSRGVLVNKRIIFKINNNVNYNDTDLNGIAEFNIRNYLTELGSYDVNVSFAGDDFTNQASKIVKVRINSLKADLTVMQEGIYYGDSNLTFRLVNSKTNNPISGAVINLVFSNGLTSNVETDSDGIASYSMPFAPGSYNLTASVINIDYSDINIVELNDFIVSKFIGQIVITQDEDCRDLKIRLYNPDTGYLFKSFNVTLKFSNGIIRDVTTDENGVASYWMNFDEGTYSVNASVNREFSEFANVTLDDMIINNKPNTEVIFSNTNLRFNYLQTGIIFAGVKGGSIRESDISIVGVPDADISIDENNMISISGLDAGNYMLSVKTTPDASHNSVTCSLNVRVNKIESVLNLDVMSFDYGSSGSSNLDFSGCSVSEDNIYVIGHPEAVIKLEDNKIVVSNLSAGEYTLSVTTTPDSNHEAVTRNVGITVNKVDSDIAFDDDVSFDYGSYGTINIDPVGCTFKYDNISVIDHPEAGIRVSSNMVRIDNLSAGDYVLKVTTTPDANHRSVTRNIDFTVNKLASTLSFRKTISFMFGAYGVTYFTTDNCEVLEDDICILDHPEAEINFEDNFITVSRLEVGDYILSVTTTPNDDNHRSVTGTLAVNVTKADSDVAFSSDVLNFDYLKSGSVVMTLFGCTVDYENITVVNHTEANITLDGNEVTVSNLTPGNYLLCVNTTPDENHNPVTCYLNITVNKIASSINFTSSEIAFDEGGSGSTGINVYGCSISDGDIVVEEHPEAVINVTGNVITVSNLTAGNYILRVTTSPDENHSAVIRSIYVVVSRIPAKASFTNDTVVFDYGGIGTVGVSVDGGYVLPKDISVLNYPKAEVYMDNNNDIRISGLDAGDYVLSVITTPDESHRAFENFINVTVNRVSSKITFGDGISFEYGKVGTADVSVDGGGVSGASVVGHPEADVRIGNNQISVSNLAVGKYTLKVTSTSDSNHYSTSAELDITVFKANSSVTFSGEIVFNYMGSASTFVIVNGGSIDAENISVAGHDAKITFDNNVISVSGLNAGVYNLTVVTTPDSNHNSVDANVSVTVNRVASEIKSYNPIVFDYLGVGSTYITVNGGSLSDAKMSVSGHSEAVISYLGNQIRVSNLNPGSYSLRVESIPDKNHNTDVKYISVTVNKMPVRIEAKSKTVALKKGSWTVKVLDSNNNPVSNMQVTLKVYTGKKFITVTVKTNAKGEATYSTKKLSKGTHKVIASIDHWGYSASSVTSSIKVIKQKALKFKVKKKISKDGSSLSITVKYKNKGINGVKLKLKVYDGKKLVKTVTLKTKTKGKYKGVAGWGTNKLKAGSHKVVIMPASITYSGSKSLKMKIKKSAKKYPKWETKI